MVTVDAGKASSRAKIVGLGSEFEAGGSDAGVVFEEPPPPPPQAGRDKT